MSTAPAGYSGTPLARKLGIKAAMRVVLRHAPAGYADWLAPLPQGVEFGSRASATTQLVHLFVERRALLAEELTGLRRTLPVDAAVWVSWPKKASKVPTDITEDTIRELALPLGLVDIKVCAVTEVWSGLKLVLRKELR
ncbi:conserved hypothetical protein [Rubrivivax sp. A210]|uniref:DUF3052 domain-containing protein n=1 Tax=Rubrivivax sp. A210 TaxID=2772301 RepID=UPI00198D166C|nr:DUF3052 domain-containing protein [Rubrivivax sp. A210]CAD5374122.1 conserved hypothetical protein [Rubrivivax sp. A210]